MGVDQLKWAIRALTATKPFAGYPENVGSVLYSHLSSKAIYPFIMQGMLQTFQYSDTLNSKTSAKFALWGVLSTVIVEFFCSTVKKPLSRIPQSIKIYGFGGALRSNADFVCDQHNDHYLLRLKVFHVLRKFLCVLLMFQYFWSISKSLNAFCFAEISFRRWREQKYDRLKNLKFIERQSWHKFSCFFLKSNSLHIKNRNFEFVELDYEILILLRLIFLNTPSSENT